MQFTTVTLREPQDDRERFTTVTLREPQDDRERLTTVTLREPSAKGRAGRMTESDLGSRVANLSKVGNPEG